MKNIFMITVVFILFSQVGYSEEVKLKDELKAIYNNIKDTKLSPWETDKGHPVTEKNKFKYKGIRKDELTVFFDVKPNEPGKIVKLYERTNNEAEGIPERNVIWKRLYWKTLEKKWSIYDPNFVKFYQDDDLVYQFMMLIAKANNNTSEYLKFISMYKINDPEKKKELLQNNMDMLKKWGDSWGGTNSIIMICDLNAKMKRASMNELIELSYARRPILKDIADKIPETIKVEVELSFQKKNNITNDKNGANDNAVPKHTTKPTPKPTPKKQEVEIPGWDF